MKKWYIIAGILIVLLPATGCFVTGTSPPLVGELEILSHDMTKGDLEVEVQATVKNVGSSTIELAEVTVKFYDADGALIETSKDAVMNLGPGESWTFNLACSGAGCDRVEDYRIEALAGTSSGIR